MIGFIDRPDLNQPPWIRERGQSLGLQWTCLIGRDLSAEHFSKEIGHWPRDRGADADKRTVGRGGVLRESEGAPGRPKGRGRRGLAKAAGVSFGTVRHALEEGWLCLEKEPCHGGFTYTWTSRDVERLQQIVGWNLDWLRLNRPGLHRFHVDRAEMQGRRLPEGYCR